MIKNSPIRIYNSFKKKNKTLIFILFRYELNQHKKIHHGNNTNNNLNLPRIQLNCSLCPYKTYSQDILDDHMDSQHRG